MKEQPKAWNGFEGQGPSEDELTEEQLEEVAGGLVSVLIPLCRHCRQHIAVHDMAICASCFRKLHGGAGHNQKERET